MLSTDSLGAPRKPAPPGGPRDLRGSERGAALLVAMVVAVLLTVLALTLTSISLNQVNDSVDFEAHEKSLIVADSGLTWVKNYLRGKDLDTELARTAYVPVYYPETDPPVGSHAWRNPISPLDARNVDFNSPANPTRMRATTGYLGPAGGTPLGQGRYFAKITDNQDEVPLGLPENLFVDRDDRVLARVVGVAPGAHSENVTHGGTLKNAVSIVEGALKRDLSLLIPCGLLVYGPNALSSISGNSFLIDGFDHAGMTAQQISDSHSDAGRSSYTGLGAAFDDRSNGDGSVTAGNLYDSLSEQQRDNIQGRAGDFGALPSLADVTDEIRGSPNPEASNIFSPVFWKEFFNRAAVIANRNFQNPTSLNGAVLGSEANPELTIAQSDLSLGGGSTGAGLLLVRGNLSVSGNFEFDGLIVALGGVFYLSGNQVIRGGAFLSRLSEDADGRPQLGAPTIDVDLNGNSNIYYDSARIRIALSLLPMLIESWREITGDIEPPAEG